MQLLPYNTPSYTSTSQTVPLFNLNNHAAGSIPSHSLNQPSTSNRSSPNYVALGTQTLQVPNSSTTTCGLPSVSGVNLNNYVNDGTNVFNFLQHSLPLGHHVKYSIRHDIFADKYVDFATLLPNFEMEDKSILFESPLTTLKMSSKGKRKQILGIDQWCNAFDIFFS